VPLMANMVDGGKTPLLSAQHLFDLGFKVVIHPGLVLRAGAVAVMRALRVLHETGSSESLADAILPWSERVGLVRLSEYEAYESDLLQRIDHHLDSTQDAVPANGAAKP
jgi:2,3-dimethylmalate lyase